MTKLKDKLSANVRMARAAHQSNDPPAPDQPAPSSASPSEPPAGTPAAEKKPAARPAPAKPGAAARTKAPGKDTTARPATAGEIPESGSELFPARVWPD